MNKDEKRHRKLEDLMAAARLAELAYLKAQNELLAFQTADAYEQAKLRREDVVGLPIVNGDHLPRAVKTELAQRKEERAQAPVSV